MLRFSKDCYLAALHIVATLAFIALSYHAATARFLQQGPKLEAPGLIGDAEVGRSVALSADGNTAIVGGSSDNNSVGAAWVFVRSSGVWSAQQKLVADGIGTSRQGYSVAMSADGNTAIVGGQGDNGYKGAAWVWTRNGGFWTVQQKLVSNNIIGNAAQGVSVALSADGNTALVGGTADNNSVGAAWLWIRSAGVWQELQKLVASGTGAGDPVGAGQQGYSVALAGDGNTAVIGAVGDNSGVGAAFVWVRNGNVWGRQGGKLVETGQAGSHQQGWSVAMSADGNTALIGGPYYSNGRGAAWVWARTGGAWSWICGRLVPSGNIGNSNNGYSVALSADGNVALTGGPADNGNAGAAWVWYRAGNGCGQVQELIGADAGTGSYMGNSVAMSATAGTVLAGGYRDTSFAGAVWPFQREAAHDFNGDAKSDILWRNTSGETGMWLMNGGTLASAPSLGPVANSWSIVGQRDFNGDGKSDLLWLDTAGNAGIWFMNGGTTASLGGLGNVGTTWKVVGTGDFNGDGKADILWRSTSGDVGIWFMNGGTLLSTAPLGNFGSVWAVAGTGDFNGDGKTDILWRSTSNDIGLWLMNGAAILSTPSLGNVGATWSIAGTGDFNGDGKADILWRSTSNDVGLWMMNGGTLASAPSLGNVGATWNVASVGDYNGDGKADILWRSTSHDIGIWFMNGGTLSSTAPLGNVGPTWIVQNAASN